MQHSEYIFSAIVPVGELMRQDGQGELGCRGVLSTPSGSDATAVDQILLLFFFFFFVHWAYYFLTCKCKCRLTIVSVLVKLSSYVVKKLYFVLACNLGCNNFLIFYFINVLLISISGDQLLLSDIG